MRGRTALLMPCKYVYCGNQLDAPTESHLSCQGRSKWVMAGLTSAKQRHNALLFLLLLCLSMTALAIDPKGEHFQNTTLALIAFLLFYLYLTSTVHTCLLLALWQEETSKA